MSKASRRSLLGLALLVLAVSAANQWWQGRQARSIGQAVAAAAEPGDIHMLASATCAPCHQARRWFTEHRIAFTECTIEHDAACRRTFEMHGAPGTPLLLVRGAQQLGFSPPHLLARLQRG